MRDLRTIMPYVSAYVFVKFEDGTVIFNLPNSMVDIFTGFSPICSTVLFEKWDASSWFLLEVFTDFVILRTIDGEGFSPMTIGTIFKPNNYSGSQKGRQKIWTCLNWHASGFWSLKKHEERANAEETTRRTGCRFAWSRAAGLVIDSVLVHLLILREREESINKETYHIYCSALPLYENTKRLQTRRKTCRKPLREPYSESISRCFVET